MKSIDKTMNDRVNTYVQWKRNLGYDLKISARELQRFADFADKIGHSGPITTPLILRWAQEAKKDSRLYRARRVEMARTFARFEATFEPRTQIPPRRILGPAHQRVQPYIYSPQDITNLMTEARKLNPSDGLRPRTYETLIGLLASTGLRVCEALNLKQNELEAGSRRLIIRETKFHKSRIVPLSSSVIHALDEYRSFCQSYPVPIYTDHFLVSEQGRALKPSVMHYTFRKICSQTPLDTQRSSRAPRLYDLRHTFACRVLQRWYAEGDNVNQQLPYLSTYLGHVKPSDTYWYLSAVPELMEIVQSRFTDDGLLDGGAI